MPNRLEDIQPSSLRASGAERPAPERPRSAAARSALKFNHMRMIAAIDQHENLSAAAASLNISQPAASRMVAEMEAIVDAPLLERHARGVSLTPYGAVLARRARSILIELNEVEQDIADLRTGRGGTVHLGAVTAPAVDLAIPAIRDIQQRYPRLDVTLQVEPSPVLARELLASRHDFIIARVPDELDPRLFESRVIGVEKACLIARRGHPLMATLDKVDLRAARDFEWVLQPPGTLLRRTLEQHFRLRDLPMPDRVLNTSSTLLTLVVLTQSDAISAASVAVSDFLRAASGLNAAVDILPLDHEIEVQPYSLITAANRTLSPAARLVYDAIVERMTLL